MNYYTCFYRHRDKSNKIVEYILRNEETLQWMRVTPEQLKEAILNKRVFIFNLKLTADGRLIETDNSDIKAQFNQRRLVENYKSLSKVKIINDNDKVDYTKDLCRKNNIESAVKFDAAFEVNKLVRFLASFSRKGKPKQIKDTNIRYAAEDGKDFANYNTEFDGDYDGGDCDGD